MSVDQIQCFILDWPWFGPLAERYITLVVSGPMKTLLVSRFTKGKNEILLRFLLKSGASGFSFNVRAERAVRAAIRNDERPLALCHELRARLGTNSFRQITVFGSWEGRVKKDVIYWDFRQDALATILGVLPRWPTDSFAYGFEWEFYKGRNLFVSTTATQSLLLHHLIPPQLSDLKRLEPIAQPSVRRS